MDVVVESPVLPVHIGIYRRIDHRVIIGGIEHGFLILIAFDPDASQCLVPAILGFLCQCREVFSSGFFLQVPECSFRADTRQADFDLQFIAV